jgi:hypothetical protein
MIAAIYFMLGVAFCYLINKMVELYRYIPRHKRIKIKFGIPIKREGELTMGYTLREDYKVPFTVIGIDAAGNESPIENITATVDKPELANVETVDNVLWLVPTGQTGSFQMTVKVDAIPGAGEEFILGIVDVDIVAGKAVSIKVNFGEAVPRG